ncbi:hypothetical protein DNTS_020637 [Danionella cerebrum]|uniref:P-type phospholipid transporter n=1 Tax=Danionella cerebrum TaxID=2873325 RepID=A0A553PYJ6_9TELE|nr:hypothetical protein DNTS_020637 [Danionella translucida]
MGRNSKYSEVWTCSERDLLQRNCIMTSKYNIITFLPVNLFEQFQEVANTYFLFLLILQLIPQISSLSWFTTIVPLVLVLSITAVKDATDDYFRHKSDNQVNNRQSQVLISGILVKEKWMNVRVGDIIKLENNQFVALRATTAHSLTESDGFALEHCSALLIRWLSESNMKVRQSLSVTSELGDPNNLAQFDGEVVCEPPNNKLDRFNGTLSWRDCKHPLTNQNMLLRGCVLRNTESCYGLVIFAGPDTKLMQNSGCTKFKRTSIDRLMNTLVLWIFVFLVCMGVILAFGNAIWEKKQGALFQSFLPWDALMDNFLCSAFLSFWSYVIILNTVVPISLYVSVEVIRLGHSYFINWDRRMFCSRTNTAAEARTTTLNEELGQVEYIFSDKTGTLTQNIMTFNKCSINGRAYGEVINAPGAQQKVQPLDFVSWNPLADRDFVFYDQSLLEAVVAEEPAVHEFLRILSLCHTVMSEEKSEGELVYKAQSPDEGALVTAARNFGFVFRSRTPGTVTTLELGKTVTYTLLAILDFNNIRKRMSVIVRNPEGRIRLYCKGADTVLFERLHFRSRGVMNITSDHLSEYAADGLRTLAVAYRDLSEVQWRQWKEKFRNAEEAPNCRDDYLAAAYEDIEQNMTLLGATAVEDKLQEGVPETIAILSLANIKIWVLTGDKQETAVNIGYSCKMLTDDMTEIFVVNGLTVQRVREELRKARERMLEAARSRDAGKAAEVQGWGGACAFANGSGGAAADWRSKEDKCAPHQTPSTSHRPDEDKSPTIQAAPSISMADESKYSASDAPPFSCKSKSHTPQVLPSSLLESVSGEFALVISGHSLAHALEADMEQEFLETACACRAVICCRVTPLQKAQVVELVKHHKNAVTLAIGDGANDVSMIKTAHIGVGISGQEGIQAVLASDYSFSQFRFLQRLLLVHGRWSYLRMCRFLCYFFYKNFAFTMVHFWFGFFCGFSAQTVYDQYFITLYNIVYTSLPVLAMGIFDQDVPEQRSVEYPKLYEPGQLNLLFNKREFFICIAQGIYTSVVLFFIPYGVLFHATQSNGFHFFGSAHNTLVQPVVWLTIALATVICIAPVLAFRFLKLELKPQLSDTVRYTQLAMQKKIKPAGRMGLGLGGIDRAGGSALSRLGRGGSRRSGYAFAHQEGYGELITSGKNMRLSSLALATFASRHSNSWIDTLRRKKQANSEDTTASCSQTPPLSTSSSVNVPLDTAGGDGRRACNEPAFSHSTGGNPLSATSSRDDSDTLQPERTTTGQLGTLQSYDMQWYYFSELCPFSVVIGDEAALLRGLSDCGPLQDFDKLNVHPFSENVSLLGEPCSCSSFSLHHNGALALKAALEVQYKLCLLTETLELTLGCFPGIGSMTESTENNLLSGQVEDVLCPRQDSPPGVVVVKLGSNIVFGCEGDLTVDGVPLAATRVMSNNLQKTPRDDIPGIQRISWGNHTKTTQSQRVHLTGTHQNADSVLNPKTKIGAAVTSNAFLSARKWQSTSRRVTVGVYQAGQEVEVSGITKRKGFDDYEEDHTRVTQTTQTHWTFNGRHVHSGVEREGILRRSKLLAADTGTYSCYRGNNIISTFRVTVGVPPEKPSLYCFRKFHTSKVRCDWTAKQPISPQPLCYMLLNQGFFGNISRVPCYFSRSRCWCAFHVDEGNRALHQAKLCVTNSVGNSTSPLLNFKLHDISQQHVKPDPPHRVIVRAVEGQKHMLKVSWSYPSSWKSGYYHQSVMIHDEIQRRLSWMIYDALPHTLYEVQLRTKDEFDGAWSDWTDPVLAETWSAPETTTGPESITSVVMCSTDLTHCQEHFQGQQEALHLHNNGYFQYPQREHRENCPENQEVTCESLRTTDKFFEYKSPKIKCKDEDCEEAWYYQNGTCIVYVKDSGNHLSSVVDVTTESMTFRSCENLQYQFRCDKCGLYCAVNYTVTYSEATTSAGFPGWAIALIIVITALAVVAIIICCLQKKVCRSKDTSHQSVMIHDEIQRRLSWMIYDALPHTLYEVQLRTKDEFDGAWSDWTDPVLAETWSAPETTTGPESITSARI